MKNQKYFNSLKNQIHDIGQFLDHPVLVENGIKAHYNRIKGNLSLEDRSKFLTIELLSTFSVSFIKEILDVNLSESLQILNDELQPDYDHILNTLYSLKSNLKIIFDSTVIGNYPPINSVYVGEFNTEYISATIYYYPKGCITNKIFPDKSFELEYQFVQDRAIYKEYISDICRLQESISGLRQFALMRKSNGEIS